MSFENFQDGLCDHLGYLKTMILAILPSPCGPNASHQVWDQFNLGLEQMWFENFQDGHHGSHLGYQNGMILAILNLYVTFMPPIKFQLNLIFSLG